MSASTRTIQSAPALHPMAALLGGIVLAGALLAGLLVARPVAAPQQVEQAPITAPNADHGWSSDPSAGGSSTFDQVSGGRGTRFAQ